MHGTQQLILYKNTKLFNSDVLVSFKSKCQKNNNIKKFRPQNIMMFDVLLDINNLHNSLSEDQYQGLQKEILSKWKADPELRSFHD